MSESNANIKKRSRFCEYYYGSLQKINADDIVICVLLFWKKMQMK